jgi:hypothetical protein
MGIGPKGTNSKTCPAQAEGSTPSGQTAPEGRHDAATLDQCTLAIPINPTCENVPVAYLIQDALGCSLRARGLDTTIPFDIRDVVADAVVINGVRDLGLTSVANPAVNGTLFALALAYRDSAESEFKRIVSESLGARSRELLTVVTSLASPFLSSTELSSLTYPERITSDDATAMITKIEQIEASDDMKAVLLAPLVIWGDIDSGVKSKAAESLEKINRDAYKALVRDYITPPF